MESNFCYPLNFQLSESFFFLSFEKKNEIRNNSTHEGTLISNSFISKRLKCFYYEITSLVGYLTT